MEFVKSEKHDLYNEDLKPLSEKERTMSPLSLFFTWFGISVQTGVFILCGTLAKTTPLWQLFGALVLGTALCAFVAMALGDIGIKYGLPFVVGARTAFGYKGVIFAALCRTLPSVFWAGFNVWLCGMSLNEMLRLTIGFSNLPVSMFVVSVIMVVLCFKGARFVSMFNWVISPVLLIIGIYLIRLLLSSNNVDFITAMSMGAQKSISFKQFILITMAIAGGWLMVVIGINDITRESISDKSKDTWFKRNKVYNLSQFFGLVPGTALFGMIGGLSMVLTGNANPVEAITNIAGQDSIAIALICQLFVFLALLSTNSGANILGSAYFICSIFKKINLKISAIMVVVVGVLIKPWNTIAYMGNVMNIMGNMVVPIGSIIFVDYFLLRKTELNLDDLYCSKGKYAYNHGLNTYALIAYVVGIILSLFTWEYMVIVSTFASGIIYYYLMKNFGFVKFPESKDAL